jgi:hypothetical protein
MMILVTASEAKQSRSFVKHPDCFVAEPVIGRRVRADPLAPRNDDKCYFVSGQPLSLAVKNAWSPGTTASCL